MIQQIKNGIPFVIKILLITYPVPFLQVVQRWNAKIPELWHGFSGKIRQTALEQRKKQRAKEAAKMGKSNGKKETNGILPNSTNDQQIPKQIHFQKAKSFPESNVIHQKVLSQKINPVNAAKAG
jgi:hypothetical protein